MAKEGIERHQVHDKKLKLVILRLDFAGVSDSQILVKLFETRFPKEYKSKTEIHNRQLNITFREEDLKEISDTLSLPVSVIKNEKVFSYNGKKNVICDASMEISQYYLGLTVKCNENYDGLDSYVESFKGAISVFKEKIPYFAPKRLGIRKVRIEEKPSIADFSSVFEDFVFEIPSFDQPGHILLKHVNMSFIELPNAHNLRINVRREMGKGARPDGVVQYRAILDLDAYYKEDALTNGNINTMIKEANQQEYIVYRSCMKESYLRSIMH